MRAVGNNLRNLMINRILAYISRRGSSRLRMAAIGLNSDARRVMYKTTGVTTKRGIVITAINAALCRNSRRFAVGGSGVHNIRSFNVVYTRSRVKMNASRSNVVILPTSAPINVATGRCCGVRSSAVVRISVAPGHTSTTSRVNITHSLTTCYRTRGVPCRCSASSISSFGVSGAGGPMGMRIVSGTHYPHCTNVAVANVGMRRSPG